MQREPCKDQMSQDKERTLDVLPSANTSGCGNTKGRVNAKVPRRMQFSSEVALAEALQVSGGPLVGSQWEAQDQALIITTTPVACSLGTCAVRMGEGHRSHTQSQARSLSDPSPAFKATHCLSSSNHRSWGFLPAWPSYSATGQGLVDGRGTKEMTR
jgi:hypothetical protein